MIEASIDKTRGQTERFRISKLGAYRGFSSAFAFAKAAADSQKGALWGKGGTTPKFKSYCKSKSFAKGGRSFAKGAPPAVRLIRLPASVGVRGSSKTSSWS